MALAGPEEGSHLVLPPRPMGPMHSWAHPFLEDHVDVCLRWRGRERMMGLGGGGEGAVSTGQVRGVPCLQASAPHNRPQTSVRARLN